jgi:hypothetical protein
VLAIGLGAGGVAMAAPANAVTGGQYCGPTQQFDGDVYAQACLTVSGYSVQAAIHVTNHGSHTIYGSAWVNHNSVHEDGATCSGMEDSDPGSWCTTRWDSIGAGGYAQAQGSVQIDGVQYPTMYSPSELIG